MRTGGLVLTFFVLAGLPVFAQRDIAGEWAAKFWVVADSLRDKRTDTALVRVVTWSTNETDQAGTLIAAGFVRNLYPALREYLPQ